MAWTHNADKITQGDAATSIDILDNGAEVIRIDTTSTNVKTEHISIKDTTLAIEGSVDYIVERDTVFSLTMSGTTPADNRITVEEGGEFNLSATERYNEDGTSYYASNLRLNLATYGTPSFATSASVMDIKGKATFKGLELYIGGPIQVTSTGVLDVIGGSINSMNNTGADVRLIFKGTVGMRDHDLNASALFSKSPAYFENVRIFSGVIFNNRVGGGDSTPFTAKGIVSLGGSGIQINGGPRVTLLNSYDIPINPIHYNEDETRGSGVPFECELEAIVRDPSGNLLDDVSVAIATKVPEGTPPDIKYFDRDTLTTEVFVDNLDSPTYKFLKTTNGTTGVFTLLVKAVTNDPVTIHEFANDTVNKTVTATYRKYGFKTLESSIQINRSTLNVSEPSMIVDTEVTKTKAQVDALTSVSTYDDILDLYRNLVASSDTDSRLEGYETDLITVEGQELIVHDDWSLELRGTTNSAPLELDSIDKKIVLHTNGNIQRGTKYFKIKTVNDMVYTGVTIDGLFEYVRDGDTHSSIRFLTQIEDGLVGYQYNFKVLGINSVTATSTALLDSTYTGVQDIYLDVVRNDYTSIMADFSGANVLETTLTATSAAFLEENVFSLVNEGALVQAWITNFDNDTQAVTVAADSITFIGNWVNETAVHIVWAIHRAVEEYNKTNTPVVEEDYAELLGNALYIKKTVIGTPNLTIGSGAIYPDGKIVFDDSNSSFLALDFGVPAETASSSTIRLLDLQVGDALFLDNGLGVTRSDITTAGTRIVVVDKSNIYKARVDRLGKRSTTKLNIGAGSSVSFDFLDFAGLEYTGSSGMVVSDYLTFDSGVVYVHDDLVDPTVGASEFKAARQTFINFMFEANREIPEVFGIDALHLIESLEFGKLNINWRMLSAREHFAYAEFYQIKDSTGGIATVASIDGNKVHLSNPSADVNSIIKEEYGVRFSTSGVINVDTYATSEEYADYVPDPNSYNPIVTGHTGGHQLQVDFGLPSNILSLEGKYIAVDNGRVMHKIASVTNIQGNNESATFTLENLDGSQATDGLTHFPVGTTVNFFDEPENSFRVKDITGVLVGDTIEYRPEATVPLARKVGYGLRYNDEDSDSYLNPLSQETFNIDITEGYTPEDRDKVTEALSKIQDVKSQTDTLKYDQNGNVLTNVQSMTIQLEKSLTE